MYPKKALKSRPFWQPDRVVSDFAYVCAADRASAAFSGHTPVFQYRFAARSGNDSSVLHGAELPFLWLERSCRSVAEQPRLAETMAGFWVNFAKTGDPNKGNSIPAGTMKWPVWSKERREVLQFQSAPNEILAVLKDGVDRKRCKQLWTKNWKHFGQCLPCIIDDVGCN